MAKEECCKDSRFEIFINGGLDIIEDFLHKDKMFNLTEIQKNTIIEILKNTGKVKIAEGDADQQAIISDYLIRNNFNITIKNQSPWK